MEQTPVLYVNGCACKWVRAGCAGGALRAGGAEMINWGSPRGCFLLCYLCLAQSRQEGRRAQKGEVVAGTDSGGKERGNYNAVKRRCLGGFISWNCGKAAWECCGNVLECCGFLCCSRAGWETFPFYPWRGGAASTALCNSASVNWWLGLFYS